ncbi:AraC family transcriptional regulator [Nocardia farcinica]|uniref:Putative transcriptional regulator n=1 Tax=Nocardia farcinica (strain IFM 10152) TaxID=247156 RepID=Q5Z0R8_NOCFA|nr:AraC family transcriptional regulator [Nocardia farcinica]BAD55973.1 putative transcriptional regulator [Nocardia farcinica IFM 10152]
MSVIRSAGLRGFRATVAELGGDAEEFAAAVGLPVAALDADDLLVPDQAVAAVLELAAHRLDRPDLGLRIARRQDLDMLGPLALAIRNSPTLAHVLECTSRYLFVHARSLSLEIEPDPHGERGVLALRYGVRPGLPTPVQGTDLGLGFVHRAIQRLVAPRYGLRSVELPYRPSAPAAAYEEFFGAPVRTGRPAALLRVPAELADRPLSGGDENLHRLALAFLAEQATETGAATAPKVRAAVQQLLGTTPPEIGVVARLLAMHPRTLQRSLAAEGTGFAAILDDVRRQQARRYLTTTTMPLAQVASLLGLAEQATLTRCCRRWWGRTPTQVRRAGLGAPT